jgi:hypothetical protein
MFVACPIYQDSQTLSTAPAFKLAGAARSGSYSAGEKGIAAGVKTMGFLLEAEEHG